MDNLLQCKSVKFLLQDPGRLWGAEKVTLELLTGLREAQYPVSVICITETRLGLKQTPLVFALKEMGVPVDSVESSGPVSSRLLHSLRSRLQEPDVGIVHAIGPKAVVYAALALRASSVKLVSTIHGWLHRFDPKERLYEILEKIALRRYRGVIVLSRYYYEWMQRLGLSSDCLAWIPTGIDVRRVISRQDAQASLAKISDFRVGMLGRLSEEKNHTMFILAARRLLDCGVDARFIIAGDGKQRKKITTKIRRNGLEERIELRGYINTAELMNGINCLAVCSRMENLPLCIMEAMCWSRPVVATSTGGIPDLVCSGESGFLVPPDASNEMADRWSELSRNRSLILQMGTRGRDTIESNFSQAACIRAHMELYERLKGHV